MFWSHSTEICIMYHKLFESVGIIYNENTNQVILLILLWWRIENLATTYVLFLSGLDSHFLSKREPNLVAVLFSTQNSDPSSRPFVEFLKTSKSSRIFPPRNMCWDSSENFWNKLEEKKDSPLVVLIYEYDYRSKNVVISVSYVIAFKLRATKERQF